MRPRNCFDSAGETVSLDENRVRQVVQRLIAVRLSRIAGHTCSFLAPGKARPRTAHSENRERHALPAEVRAATEASLSRL